MLPGTRYLPPLLPDGKRFLSHVGWSPRLISLLVRTKHSIMFVYLCLKLVSAFTGCGKKRLMSRELRVRMRCARQSSQPASPPGRKATDTGTAGGNVAPTGLGWAFWQQHALCLPSAFLCRGSPAFEVLSTVRFCGVPAGMAEMPQGSDLTADRPPEGKAPVCSKMNRANARDRERK